MRHAWPLILSVVSLLVPAGTATSQTDPDSFIGRARTPEAYVLSCLESHPVVIFGEAHWVSEEVGLIRDLVPSLPSAGTHTLAMEQLRASSQGEIDAVVSAASWNESAAMVIVRDASLPHEEYLRILEAVWKTRRERGDAALRLLAIGPGDDWRRTLPPGESYDSFMASRVKAALAARKGSVLVYTGLHHAFARYMQPDTTLDGRARGFMVRMGNLLRWELGEKVFVITTHRPIPCGTGEDFVSCEPFGGAIDCAASRVARGPFGFDVAGSPFAGLRFGAHDLYVPGYPDLRLVDFVDGLVWFAPPDALHQTRLIPLARYAPDDAALATVAAANPFDDRKGLTRAELEALWRDESERRLAPILEVRWKGVGAWSDACAAASAGPGKSRE